MPLVLILIHSASSLRRAMIVPRTDTAIGSLKGERATSVTSWPGVKPNSISLKQWQWISMQSSPTDEITALSPILRSATDLMLFNEDFSINIGLNMSNFFEIFNLFSYPHYCKKKTPNYFGVLIESM